MVFELQLSDRDLFHTYHFSSTLRDTHTFRSVITHLHISSHMQYHYTLFYEQPYVSIRPQCRLTFFINSASNVALVLVNTHNHIIILRHFIFHIFVSKSMFYLCDLFFVFSLTFILINHVTHWLIFCCGHVILYQNKRRK